MTFCPDWIFDAAMARSAEEFLAGEVPLHAIASKYAKGLSEKYSEVRIDELSQGVEDLVRFLGEVDAGDEAVNFLRGFTYFRLRFEAANKPRKLRVLFGSADDPVKVKGYSTEDTVKKFKAYVFALRSNSAPLSPAGWRIEDETDLEHLAEVASKTVSILDGF